jgi:glycosyltransferase involved in cell wall biosynthesis
VNKRLLFITPIFPKNNSEDSVVPFISQFTQQFNENTKVEIDVISLMYPFSTAKYSIDNITIYPMGSYFKSFVKQIPYFIKAILKGKSLHKQNPYDGILCFWYRESALVGKVLSRLLNIKQTVWMLGQDINKDNKYIWLLKIPHDRLIMMSLQQSDLFYEYHKIHIQKIANVAITRKLFPEFNSGERKYDILGVGNLGALKNYSLFIDIISDLKYKNYNAIIIGEGEEMAMLKEKVKQLGLTENLRFLGALPHATVLDYMNQSKIFLHTSKSEGGGTVLQEALYSGCKVVSTIAVENNLSEENFYFNSERQALVNQMNLLLEKPLVHQRIENFKMENTIKIIYDSFYSA